MKKDAYKDCHYKKRQCHLETSINVDYHFTWKQCYSGKISEEISRGSYAAVYKGRTVGNTCCAIKMPHPHILSFENSLKSYKDEIEIHSTLDHPSIVSFYDIYFIDDNLPPLLIMERMWISLYSFIEQKLLGDFLLLLKLHILLDVAKALSYLHSRNIVHRDVTLSNILLTKELNAKISDFGGAQQLDTTKCSFERCSVPGNFLYMPPESFNSNPVCGSKLDVFSFGCNLLCTINETIPCHEHRFSKAGVAESYLNNMPSEQPLLKELAESCLAHMPEHRPDIECVIKVLNTIVSLPCIKSNSGQRAQMQHAPSVKKHDINIAQVASRKRLKALKEHGSSEALMQYEILATNSTILNFVKHNAPECGQHIDWLLNLATNFNFAITEVYLYQTYLEKYVFSSQPYFFQFCFIQSNISAMFLNDVINPTTAAITAAHATYFVAFSQSRLKQSEILFTKEQMITISTPTKRKASTVPKVFNVLLLKSSNDETYSHIPFGKRQHCQEKHYLLQLLSTTHHMGTGPCIQQHELVQESLIEEPFTNRDENSVLGNSTRYTKLICSCSYMSYVAKESLSVINTKMNQCSDQVNRNCIDIAKVVFSLSDSTSASCVHSMAAANLPCNDAKLFEYFGFTIALVVQRFGASYLFCYQCSQYACYCINAWLIVVYHTIVKHAGKLLCITGLFSAYFSADGAQKKFWFSQYTECTLYDVMLSIDNIYTVGFVKTFSLVDACNMLYLNAQHKPTHSNAYWMSKLEFTKPKQSSTILASLCTESVLCLQQGATFDQLLSKVVSGVKSCLKSSHHISIKYHFICNQEQIESVDFYAKATQYNLQGNCIDSYNVINQCSVSVASDESSVGVLTLPLYQHKQPHTAILPRINCTHAGELSTTVVTRHYNTLNTYSDINKQQATASFKRYSSSTSSQLYHHHYTYGKGYMSFYVCSTVQKQVTLSIQQCSLHLRFYYNMQLVLTLQCAYMHTYHQLSNDALLCNGEAVVSNLWNGLVCSLESYYFPRKHNTNAQESVPMLWMQNNLLSKDMTSCLSEIASANSCKIITTDMCFNWQHTLPAITIQDTSNALRQTIGQYGNNMNLSVSAASDGNESSSQVTILKIKATQINFNMISLLAKNNNVTALNTRNSVKEASRKHDVMKCTAELDEWPFLHTGKAFICNNVFSLSLLLRLSPMLGKEWLHKPSYPTKSCKSCFNQPALIRNLTATLCCQVILCTDHESAKAMENFHHNFSQCYTHASTLAPLLELLQYKHRHLVTQCVQVNSCQHYNAYFFSVQVLALTSVTRSVDQLCTLCIAYNFQIRESIVVEQFQVMQYKQYTLCCQEFHLYSNNMSATCKISQIDAQQKSSSWLNVKRAMPESLHQSDDNLLDNVIQLEIHSCVIECNTKSELLCPSVDLQLDDVQGSVLPKPSAIGSDLHHLNSATSVDQYTCHMTKNFVNEISCTIKDDVPRTRKAKQPLTSCQDEQLLNTALTTITCSEQPPPFPRNVYVLNKHLYCGPTMLLADTCIPHLSRGYENTTV